MAFGSNTLRIYFYAYDAATRCPGGGYFDRLGMHITHLSLSYEGTVFDNGMDVTLNLNRHSCRFNHRPTLRFTTTLLSETRSLSLSILFRPTSPHPVSSYPLSACADLRVPICPESNAHTPGQHVLFVTLFQLERPRRWIALGQRRHARAGAMGRTVPELAYVADTRDVRDEDDPSAGPTAGKSPNRTRITQSKEGSTSSREKREIRRVIC